MSRETIADEMERKLRAKHGELVTWTRKEMRKSIAAENRHALGAGQEECDCATATQSDHMHFLNMSLQHVMMKQIDRALRKIGAGSYGFCEKCEAEIDHERLRILPVAVYCRDCQELLEEYIYLNRKGRSRSEVLCV